MVIEEVLLDESACCRIRGDRDTVIRTEAWLWPWDTKSQTTSDRRVERSQRRCGGRELTPRNLEKRSH